MRLRLRHTLSVVALITACGGKEPPPQAPDEPAPVAQESTTELERRRDAACEALGPVLTQCAIDDARRTMSEKELAELELDKTAPVHTRKFVDSCQEQQLSSRQVRVYEVCLREETACEPLIACLDHAKPQAGDPAPATP
jgi:hypothetical protein